MFSVLLEPSCPAAVEQVKLVPSDWSLLAPVLGVVIGSSSVKITCFPCKSLGKQDGGKA